MNLDAQSKMKNLGGPCSKESNYILHWAIEDIVIYSGTWINPTFLWDQGGWPSAL